jgi:hypothetical protein
MKHRVPLARKRILSVLVIALIAGHGLILYQLHSHLASTAVVGLIILVLLKHFGVFGPIYAFFRRSSRRETDGDLD